MCRPAVSFVSIFVVSPVVCLAAGGPGGVGPLGVPAWQTRSVGDPRRILLGVFIVPPTPTPTRRVLPQWCCTTCRVAGLLPPLLTLTALPADMCCPHCCLPGQCGLPGAAALLRRLVLLDLLAGPAAGQGLVSVSVLVSFTHMYVDGTATPAGCGRPGRRAGSGEGWLGGFRVRQAAAAGREAGYYAHIQARGEVRGGDRAWWVGVQRVCGGEPADGGQGAVW